MKKIFPFLFPVIGLFACNNHHSTAGAGLLPGYNDSMYTTVIDAAAGVGTPFLLQQHWLSMDGVTVSDTTLTYNGCNYKVHNEYINPTPTLAVYYYLLNAQYSAYGLPLFHTLWPERAPNVFYSSADSTFASQVDCVGYGTRLLSVTGDTSVANNAYRNLQQLVTANDVSPFAGKGVVATAYQFAVAFPTLQGSGSGWSYIAGNLIYDSVVNYNKLHSSRPLGTYTGAPKGGFQAAQAGDILSFGFGLHSKDNGHFMVIAHQPTVLNADSLRRYIGKDSITISVDSLVRGYNLFGVPVYDCSGINAHFFDSRVVQSGIGHGTLVVLTSKTDNTPMGYLFGPPADSTNTIIYPSLFGPNLYAVTVGRWTGTGGTKATVK